MRKRMLIDDGLDGARVPRSIERRGRDAPSSGARSVLVQTATRGSTARDTDGGATWRPMLNRL